MERSISSLPFMFIAITLFLVIISSSSPFVNAKEITQHREEATALLAWKASLDKGNLSRLSSWAGSNPCTNNWTGISCNGAGRVTHISLINFGLKGTLHDLNFSSFPHLNILDLGKNALYGTIPSIIGSLSKLTYLSFAENINITGKIPSEIGLLTDLECINLYNCQTSGSIPREIGMLRSLSVLYLYSNNLNGSIPREVGMMSSLSILSLGSNFLTGTIPTSIGNLVHLNILDLSSNQLTGSIPTSIGKLVNLTELYLYSNQLSGSIPQEVGMLRSLVHLQLLSNVNAKFCTPNEITKTAGQNRANG